MKRSTRIVIVIFLVFINYQKTEGQVFGFHRTDSITVINNIASANDTLSLAWSGGLSHSQFSPIDLNNDSHQDLLVFDRVGHRLLLFNNKGIMNTASYANNFNDLLAFPQLTEWVLLEDYNGDGKNDVFQYYLGGIRVYKNVSTPGNVQFTLAKDQIYSNYVPSNLVLYVSPADFPGITDVDNDGDLDILTFGFSSGCVEFHKNLSQENYGHSDSLEFIRATDNWGLFSEGVSLYDIHLGDSCDTGRHAGSNILAIDMDNDADKDIILGDVGGSNMAYVRNGGSPSFATMNLVDVNFPQNHNSTIPINLSIFPAAFYLDIDNDNKKDLIIGNSSQGSSETKQSIWRYKNNGTTALPDFDYIQNNFLQDNMIEVGEGAFPVLFDYNRSSYWKLNLFCRHRTNCSIKKHGHFISAYLRTH